MHRVFIVAFLLAGIALLLVACGSELPVLAGLMITSTPTAFQPVAPTQTPTPAPTTEPLAARVNGELIPLSWLDGELTYNKSLLNQSEITQQDRLDYLDKIIDVMLLAQGAPENGSSDGGLAFEAQFQLYKASLGGPEKQAEWIKAHGPNYSQVVFRESFRIAYLASCQMGWITAKVPAKAEQIHFYKAIFTSRENAERIYQELLDTPDRADKVFALNGDHDSYYVSDVGWSPRGFMIEPPNETVLFALNPGEFSPVLKDGKGFFIARVIEKEKDRALGQFAKEWQQQKAIEDWLSERRKNSQIEIFLP